MTTKVEFDRCLRLFGVVGIGYLIASYLFPGVSGLIGFGDPGRYQISFVFSWPGVVSAMVCAALAALMACSRLRSSGVMWLSFVAWLCIGIVGALPLLPSKAWSPSGGFPSDQIQLGALLIHSASYFVLWARNKGAFRLGLLFMALSPVLFVSKAIELGVGGLMWFVVLTELAHQLVLSAAFFIFAFQPRASQAGVSSADPFSERCLRKAAIFGLVYAVYWGHSFSPGGLLPPRYIVGLWDGVQAGRFLIGLLLGYISAVVFCMSFAQMHLAGRGAAVLGMVGSWMPLMIPVLCPSGLYCPNYTAALLNVIAFCLVIASLVRLRDLLPVWARWCVAGWAAISLLHRLVWLVSGIMAERALEIGQVWSLVELLFPSGACMLVLGYAGMLYRCRQTMSAADCRGM